MPHFQHSLSSLPLELIEEIIIISTLLGDARAPSTLAQTCRPFRALVYHQLHKHLWREMFLILFDDPRPALDVRALGRAPQPQEPIPSTNKGKGKSKNHLSSHDYPWEDEYKLRVWAESFIRRRTQPLDDASSDLPSTDAELYTVLDTLLRVVLTAAPLPYDELASIASDCRTRSLTHPHPIFSPLLLAAHALPIHVLGSRNISWLGRVLAHGLPRAIMIRLSAFDENGEIDVQKNPVVWDGLLVKLVARIGLTALVKSTTRFAERHDHAEVGGNDSDAERNSNVDSDEVLGTSGTTSQDDVRRLARVRVFNMSYLSPSRSFGPFLPLEMESASPTAVPPVPSIPDTNLNLESINFSLINDAGRDNDNDELGQDKTPPADDYLVSNITSIYPLHATASSAQRKFPQDTPGDHLLHFDWAWIAAARLVIEFNLRDLLRSDRHQGVLRAFLSLQGLRSCSAPGFPPAAPEAVVAGKCEGEEGRTFKDGEGWDWAGVEGQWRRCVCWLDYRELVDNNAKPLAERFGKPTSNEVMRIVPITLRIARYSRAHALWPGRPKIHFEGKMYAGATDTADSDVREVRGTVQMVASGDVRWSIMNYREGPVDEQRRFVTEGVQIGGPGSAMGVISMWASGDQQVSTPLGPCWDWKVGLADVFPTNPR